MMMMLVSGDDDGDDDGDVGVPYEVTTYTSDIRGAGTEADVYVVLYGRDTCTSQKSLCPNKSDRKKFFNKAEVAKFVLDVSAFSRGVTHCIVTIRYTKRNILLAL